MRHREGRTARAAAVEPDTPTRTQPAGGEASKKFERQSSLFALALSDVLLVNVWCQDLGRHDASNMSLLRTVFEVHLQLFAKQEAPASPDGGARQKTVLLFLIRDHIEQQTPFPKLEQLVRRDIGTIWASVNKPAHLEAEPVDALFDVAISSPPPGSEKRDRSAATPALKPSGSYT